MTCLYILYTHVEINGQITKCQMMPLRERKAEQQNNKTESKKEEAVMLAVFHHPLLQHDLLRQIINYETGVNNTNMFPCISSAKSACSHYVTKAPAPSIS